MGLPEPIRKPRGDTDAPPATLPRRASEACGLTAGWLLDHQHPAGYWCGELEGDSILESEYLLLLAWLGQEHSPIAKKCAAALKEQQLPEGGWAMYPGGKLEISGSVKAYFALKLTGSDPQAEYMRRASAAIRAAGGADAINSFTRFYLALLGQISYDHCPAVPPELTLLPTWSPINLYAMSAWSRTIVVPLAIMWAHRPVRKIEESRGISELFLEDPEQWPELRCPGLTQESGWFTWDNFFRTADRTLKWLEARGLTPLRKAGLEEAQRWMTLRFSHSDGLGAIFPPIIWSIVALKCLGYADESAELQYNFEHLAGLTVDGGDSAWLQPCLSPVWDTVIALRALAVAGATLDEPAIAAAVDWVLSKEITRPGDWSKTVKAAPGGWCFEHHNEFYPDVDDTAMALIAFRDLIEASGATSKKTVPAPPPTSVERRWQIQESDARLRWLDGACQRAKRWMLAMQNRDGGWGAFDKDNDREFLCRVPFADHNAMIDPSTPDLTARALEALGRWGAKPGDPAVDRAIAYLRKTQESDGAWFGRWGVNYIYGTWQGLIGLAAVNVDRRDPMVQLAANWLLSHQQQDGGWGESADTYENPSLRGQGPPTASQTAWALLGLMAAGLHDHPAVERGVNWLCEQQQPDGTWLEEEFTGTGFPRVFYLKYHYYPIYFPLLALATYRRAQGAEAAPPAFRRRGLRVVG